MNSSPKKSRPLFWFYLLVAYVILQFTWWSYLMVELNNEIYIQKTELNLLKGESLNEVVAKGNELNNKLHKRWIMIAGEGTVFVSLLLLGILQIRKTFKKETELAHQQKNFLLSVTHELKSPIASAKLQLQTLQKHELDRLKQKEILTNAINDTDRLNALVENILLAAKIDNGIYKIHKENCNISECITQELNQIVASFKYKQKVVPEIDPDIYLDIDRISFPSILLNLIENASKYSPENSTISVSLKRCNTKICLTVKDEGTGIAEGEKKNVFRKFYRLGNEETRRTKGTGLGLYIVNYLAQQHNGVITVKNNSPKGSIFEVTFT